MLPGSATRTFLELLNLQTVNVRKRNNIILKSGRQFSVYSSSGCKAGRTCCAKVFKWATAKTLLQHHVLKCAEIPILVLSFSSVYMPSILMIIMIISNVFFCVLFLPDGTHSSLYESKEQGIKRRQNKEIRSSRNKPHSNKTDTRALKSTFWSATVTTKTHTHTHLSLIHI